MPSAQARQLVRTSTRVQVEIVRCEIILIPIRANQDWRVNTAHLSYVAVALHFIVDNQEQLPLARKLMAFRPDFERSQVTSRGIARSGKERQ